MKRPPAQLRSWVSHSCWISWAIELEHRVFAMIERCAHVAMRIWFCRFQTMNACSWCIQDKESNDKGTLIALSIVVRLAFGTSSTVYPGGNLAYSMTFGGQWLTVANLVVNCNLRIILSCKMLVFETATQYCYAGQTFSAYLLRSSPLLLNFRCLLNGTLLKLFHTLSVPLQNRGFWFGSYSCQRSLLSLSCPWVSATFFMKSKNESVLFIG